MVFITKLTGLGIMDGSKTCIMKKNIIIESKFKTRCFQEIVGTPIAEIPSNIFS